jgi:hypothetical protein
MKNKWAYLCFSLIVGGCREAVLNSDNSSEVKSLVLRKGMSYYDAQALIVRAGADSPAVVSELPHDIGTENGHKNYYRLPSGYIVQLYGEEKGAETLVWMIGISRYKPTRWDWRTRDDPERQKVVQSMILVHEFDLGTK